MTSVKTNYLTRRQQAVREKLKQSERGTTFVMIAFFIVALFGFMALSIDVGNVYREQQRARVATDAGALAGATLLTNSPQNVASTKKEAEDLALINGVTAAEIASGTGAAVQVGIWTTNRQFLANQTVNGRYNAVAVPARRSVDLLFGKVVGLSQMTPGVQSVAMLTGAGSAINVIPWGTELGYVQGKQVGDIVTIWGGNGSTSPGNTGALNINGDIKNPHDWSETMKSSNGCECVVSLNDQQTSMRPGIPNWVSAAWDYRIQNGYTIVTIPVVQEYKNGSHDVVIVGFIQAELLSVTSGGVPHFSGTFKILSALFGGTGGGPSGGPFAQARVLVQ